MKSYVTGRGGYNAICDVCGFQFKNTEIRKRWDGLMVCPSDFEVRHPQELIRTRNDQHPVPFVRKEDYPNPGFLEHTYFPSAVSTSPAPGTYGNRFTVGTGLARTLIGIRVMLGSLDESRARPYTGTLGLYRNSDSVRLYRQNDVEIWPGRWNSFPLEAIDLTAGETYTVTMFLNTSTTFPYVTPRPTVPTANNGMAYVGSYYNLGTPMAIPTNSDLANLYLIDVITRDGDL